MRTAIRIALIVIAVVLGAVFLGVMTLTNTNWGRERVRRLTLGALAGSVHGIVHIGAIRGNLLEGLVLEDFVITDSAGRPFVSVQRARAQYRILDLLRKRIDLASLALEQPVIVLSKLPGADSLWNFQRIFPPSGKSDTTRGFGSWISLSNVRITDGHITVRMPWSPSDTLAAAQRDSAIRVALAGETRSHVIEVPHGYQSVMDFQQIQAALPRIRLADPDTVVRLFRVGELRMLAFPFTPPGAEIRSLRGDFQMDADSLWFRNVAAALPGTRLALGGAYLLKPGDVNLSTTAQPLALADLRWLYPALPDSGGGSARLVMRYRPKGESDYTVPSAEIALAGGSLKGKIGVAMASTGGLRLHDTDLSFAGVRTETIEQLVPGLDIPASGRLGGEAVLAGALTDMNVDGDVSFDDAHDGTSRLIAVGNVGMLESGRGVRMDDLRLRFEPVRVALARTVAPKLPVGGTITGTATLNGSTASRIVAQARLIHRDRGNMSRIEARAAYRGGARRWVDAEVRAEPLSLATVGRFAPALKLHGTLAGQVKVIGTLDSLSVLGDLRLPDGGSLRARGWADVASSEKRYDLSTVLDVFDLRTVTELGPRTSLSAVASARGVGTDPATMRATIAADVSKSAVDSIPFDSLSVRLAIAEGVAKLDTLALTGAIGNASARGEFGLADGRSGSVAYAVHIDSLSGLARLLPRDTSKVQPRPGRVAAALEQARADSAREAQRTEVARAATGAPPPKLKVDTIPSVPRDSLSGSFFTEGKVTGWTRGFGVRGRLGVQKLVASGNVVRRGEGEYAVVDGGTPALGVAAGLSLDSVQAAGFALDSVEVRASYRKPGGTVDLAIYQDSGTDYRVRSDYALQLDHDELNIHDMTLRFGERRWRTVRPSTVQWGKAGLEIGALDLTDGGDGRIYLDGRVPTEGEADLGVRVSGLQIGDLVGLLQSDVSARGTIVLEARLTGTRAAPKLRGAAGIANATYQGAPIPDFKATMEYADRRLESHAELSRGKASPLATLDANVPVNLALDSVAGDRLLDMPMKVDFTADSLPLDALPKFTDAVADVQGRLIGAVAARGTPKHPSLAGRLDLDLASFRIVPMGVTLGDIAGVVRLLGDSIAIDTLHGTAGGGTVVLGGAIGVKELARPSFALHIAGRNALVLDTEQGRLFADANLRVRGPYDHVAIGGNFNVLNGVIYIPTAGQASVIALDDPAVFHVVRDSAEAVESGLLPSESPLLKNLEVNVALNVAHDTWVRSPEANVEIYSPDTLTIHMSPASRSLTMSGVMNTDRGDYTYLGRRFILSHGSVTFTNEPEINPLLQINATRSINLAGRGEVDINIAIGGTLQQPSITLGSDAQPPISQSDLLSYLAFGQSSSSLLQAGGTSSVGGGAGGGGRLAGQAAGIATRQLAAVALDVLAKDAQANLSRSLGTDVLNITPADIPTELTPNDVQTLLAGTQVEAGKYLNKSTFVVFQARPTFVAPGARVEYRMPRGYRIEASIEPRFLIRQPSLSTLQDPKPTSVLGAFLIREWKF
jgi:translocation and assembly module TamB